MQQEEDDYNNYFLQNESDDEKNTDIKLLAQSFFNREDAEKFKKYLKSNGISDENIDMAIDRDAFNQTQYIVKWLYSV